MRGFNHVLRGLMLAGVLIALIALLVFNISDVPGYSVVYFENSTLPQYLNMNKTYTITFDVISHEKQTVTYTYQVLLNGNEIKTGNFTLAPGGLAQIPVDIKISNIDYNKVITDNISQFSVVSGVSNITGKCSIENSTVLCLPLSYHFYSFNFSFNFVLNSSLSSWTITRVVRTVSKNLLKVQNYSIHVLKLDNSSYKVISHVITYQLAPEPVVLVVVIKTSTNKTYELKKFFQVSSMG